MIPNLLQFWPTAEATNECVGTEAETLSEAVLLAVHRPMRFLRENLTGGGTPISVSETELLREFLTENLPSGNLLLPIVGSSGIGKSHAIRWLDAQLRRRQDHIKRHIILIPKSASLREVLRLILKDLQGPAYDEARRDLQAAPDDMDDLRASEELRAKLLIALERRTEKARAHIQAARMGGNPSTKEDHSILAHAGNAGLQALLSDPVISPHFMRGSLLEIARRVTAGLQVGTNPKTQFEEKDLRLPYDDDRLREAAAPARNYYRTIIRDTKDNEQAFAVNLLNEVVDDSIAQMMKLDGTRLSDIFTTIREELLKEGKELVLLVEDFAAMAGIQGSLLDAMIKEAVHGGKKIRCTMRTALAVTAGYLANRDTVNTRARFQWVIKDIPNKDDGETVQEIVDFVGGYLNAARCGRERLEREFRSRSEDNDLFAWIPCFEDQAGLEDEDLNTLDAFGRSSDRRYALFPLNKDAIEQIARKSLTTHDGKLTFNPRKVINHVLWDALHQFRELFFAGAFPPPRYLDFKPAELDPEVIDAVSRQFSETEISGRCLSLLRYWGGKPTLPDVASLHNRVWRAFGLVPLEVNQSERTSLKPAGKTGPEKHSAVPPSSPPAESWDREIRDLVQKWAVGAVDLGQNEANRIRRAVAEGIDAYIFWDRELCPKVMLADTNALKRIYLPRARGGMATVTEASALVTIAKDSIYQNDHEPELNRLRLELISLLRLYDEHCSMYDDNIEDDIARYANFMERVAPRAIAYVRDGGLSSRSQVLPCVVQSLLVSARAIGLEKAHSKDEVSLLATIFRLGPTAERPNNLTGESENAWERLLNYSANARNHAIEFVLSEVAARQGEGKKVYAVDAVRLLEAIREFRKDWLVHMTPQLRELKAEEHMVQSFCQQMAKAPNAVRERLSLLKVWRKQVTDMLGSNLDGPKKIELLENLQEALSLAQKTNTYPSTAEITASTLREKLSGLRQLPIVDAVRAMDAVSDGETFDFDSQLVAVSMVDDRIIRETNKVATVYETFLERCSKDVKGRLETLGPDLAALAREKLKDMVLEIAGLAGITPDIPEVSGSVEDVSPNENQLAKNGPGEASGFLIKARELKLLLRLLGDREAQKQLAKVLNSASEQLDKVIERARCLRKAAELLVSKKLMKLANFTFPKSFIQPLNTLHKRLILEPNKVTEGTSFERLITGLEGACNELEIRCIASWAEYVGVVNPNVDSEFLGRITLLSRFQKEIKRIEVLNQQIKESARSLPKSSEDISNVQLQADEIRELWKQLPSPEVHKDVKNFLDAIKQQRGAPLNLLTPKVRDWLESEGLKENFSIQCSDRTPMMARDR